ncbi:single-stranded DNA-binding protein [Aliikangiella sp. G2MR2-5]|uniref:single-stranded DNA-binding protein n=1 Tax=Aliikangiella sp. G2MR2-5 TaxID=2788943 RepID=UPI0018A8F51A|nr:single-stranded DNA-binding protein [Aliikangiella sp. G2MR2-5]
MSYFRADVTLFAQMVEKDCLRYSTDNRASLRTLFKVPGKAEHHHYLVVTLFDELAEDVSRMDLADSWFEVKGELVDRSPEFSTHKLPELSVRAYQIESIPIASSTLLNVEVIGRLTHDPEHIIKGNDFEFARTSVAVNRKERKACFFNISIFKPRLIKEAEGKLKKGIQVLICGELTFFDKGGDSKVHTAIKMNRFLTFS